MIHTLRPILRARRRARRRPPRQPIDAGAFFGARAVVADACARATTRSLAFDGVPWSALASLGTLTVLHLDGNRLTGDLPAEVGTLTRLETLTLDENRLARLPDAPGR